MIPDNYMIHHYVCHRLMEMVYLFQKSRRKYWPEMKIVRLRWHRRRKRHSNKWIFQYAEKNQSGRECYGHNLVLNSVAINLFQSTFSFRVFIVYISKCSLDRSYAVCIAPCNVPAFSSTHWRFNVCSYILFHHSNLLTY